jgi:thioesterase domain-containing protein
MFLPPAVKNVRRTLAVAENHYRVQAYSGKILLFRASDKGLRGLEDPTGGWHKYAAGGIEVHEIDGDHGDILNEPNVESLARELRDCLERTQSEQSSRVSTSEPLPQPDLQLN